MEKKTKRIAGTAVVAMICAAVVSGCGGGGGRAIVAGPGGTPAPAVQHGKVTGRIMLATEGAGRTAPRPADRFLMKIPVNQPQQLDVPESGYDSLAGAQVKVNIGDALTTVNTDTNGLWQIDNVPTGTQQFIVSKNGKQTIVPITVKADTTTDNLALITENESGAWEAECQNIHGDGTDGYKKETHHDSTSDTVFEGGTRDHHESEGKTLRDVTDDGIVDQQFPDPDDDGIPDGPVTEAGGEPVDTQPDNSDLVNNSPPDVDNIDSRDDNGSKNDTVTTGDSLDLTVDASDPDGDPLTVSWTVEDPYGNDLTNLFLNESDVVAPTFSPPSGEFSKPGAYLVVVTVTDPDGVETEKDIILTVDDPENKSPHASIKANHTAGDAPLTVDFTCDAFDNDGEIVSYCWDFDKSNGIDQNDCDDTRPEVTKTFISEGKYRVTCIVTDDKGAIGFAKRVIVVRKKNHPPQITSFTASKYTLTPGEKINVTTVATDQDGDTLTYDYTSTQGTLTDTDGNPATAEWTAPAQPGNYIVEVTVTDTSGETDVDALDVEVESPANHPPTITATATPSSGDAPLDVALAATASDPDGDAVTVTWDFNAEDGLQTNATGYTASVTYGGLGEYRVTAKACDTKGACSYKRITVTVTQPNRDPFISSCSAATQECEVGDVLALTVQAADDDNDELSYAWTATGGLLSNSDDQMPRWTLPSDAGTYTATVTVTDGHAPVSCETSITVEPESYKKKPAPPADCNATGGDASALIQWKPSPSDDIDHYQVSRSDNGGDFIVINGAVAASALSLGNSGLTNGAVYKYRIEAVNTEGFVSEACEPAAEVVPQQEIDAVIPVGEDPTDVEYNPITDHIYVPNSGSDTVSVIDGNTQEVIETIPVGDEPTDACADKTNSVVYVTNAGGDTVSVIDEDSLSVIATINVGDGPKSCVVDQDTHDVYVGNENDGTISVIDGDTLSVVNTITTGGEPRVCDVNETLDTVYVTDRTSDLLMFLHTGTGETERTVNTGNAPEGCVSNDTTGEVYVPDHDDGRVEVIDGDTGEQTGTIDTGGNPRCTCGVNEISNQIYITNEITNEVQFINGATKVIEASVHTGGGPSGACSDSTRNKVCVANKDGNSVSIIDNPLPPVVVDPYAPETPAPCKATAINGEISFEWATSTATDFAGYNVYRGDSPGGAYSEVASLINSTVYIDLNVLNGLAYYYKVESQDRNGNKSGVCSDSAVPVEEVTRIVKTGGTGPCCMDTVQNLIYIANEETNTVDVINRDTYEHITTLIVPDCCGDMVVDHVTNKIYITNKTTNKMTIIDGTHYIIEDVIELGFRGGQCTVNETTHEIYIVNEETNQLVIMNPDTFEKVYIPIESGCPCDVEVDHVTNKIYITNKITQKLTIIDGTHYIVEDIIDIGSPVSGCIINEITNQLYMTSETTNEVVVFNTKTEQITNHIYVGGAPSCSPCGVNTTSNQVYITNSTSGTLSLIDGATNSLAGTLTVGDGPIGVVVDPETNTLYVLNGGDDTLAVVDNPLPATPSDTEPPATPAGLAAVSSDSGITLSWAANSEDDLAYYSIYRKNDPEGEFGAATDTTINNTYADTTAANGTVYFYAITAVDLSNNESDKTDVVSGRTDVPTEVAVGSYPANVAVNETLNRVFVTNRDSNNVTIIDAITHAVITTVPVGVMPWGVATDPVTGRVYVANTPMLTVTILNGATGGPINNVPTGGTGGVMNIAIDNINSVYYASHAGLSGGLVVPFNLATDAPGAAIETRPGSVGIAVNRLTRLIYVANAMDSSVTVISGLTNTVVGNIPVCSQPTDVVLNETANKIYVTCGGTGQVAVINGATGEVSSYVTVGLAPMGMGFDATRNLIYVANSSSGAVSVIDGATDRVIGAIQVGGDPTDVGVHSGLNEIFVSLKTAGKVIIRDGL